MQGFIHQNTINNHKSKSGKALYLTVTYGGFNTGKKIEWFPLSKLTISTPNECGWSKITIPEWIINQKHINGGAFEEIEME